MNRNNFIEECWSPYPPAQAGWRDVADYIAQSVSGGVVCGRLSLNKDARWLLSSGGATIEIDLSKVETWMGELRKQTPFEVSLLADGDLVAVRIEQRIEQTSWQRSAGALKLIAASLMLLVPAQEALPPSSEGFDVARSRAWSDFIQTIRNFFVVRGFIEAATPTLVPSPGTEPYLEPFSTFWEIGSFRREFFLPTSPEFHLKKMLTLGWTKIFEFKSCFRNGEIGPHHQPEFLMLEWYRAYADLDSIANDVEQLLLELCARFCPESAPPTLARTTMVDLFAQHFSGFALRADTSRAELIDLAERIGVCVSPDDDWNDVFFRIFIDKIEPSLGREGPLLVRGYPSSQAALSRIRSDGFADRFEVYWRGLEIANAFHELNDPLENETRFAEDAAKKTELGRRPVPRDEKLMSALRYGLPPSGGIALGAERLFMALLEIESIDHVRAFPIRQSSATS